MLQSKAYLHRFSAVAVLSFMLVVCPISRADASPAALLFFGHLLNFFASLNDLRKSGADPTAMATHQTREMVIVLHERMNWLSQASIAILSELKNLPKVMRNEIRAGITLEHIREAEGLVDLVKTDVELLIKGKPLPVPLTLRLSSLQNRRSTLIRGGRAGLPILVTALALEEFLLWEANVDSSTIRSYRQSYLTRFQRALDIRRDQSLANTYYQRQQVLDGWCVNANKGSKGLCDSSCIGGGCVSNRGLQTEMDSIEDLLLSVSKFAREAYSKWVVARKNGQVGSHVASKVLNLHFAFAPHTIIEFKSTHIPYWALPMHIRHSYHHLTERKEDVYRAQVYLAQSEAALLELLVAILQMYGEEIPEWFNRHNIAYGTGHDDFDPALVKPLNYSAYKGHTKFIPLMGPRSEYCRNSASKYKWSHGATEPRYLSCYRRIRDGVSKLARNIEAQCVTCEVPHLR